MAHTHLSAACGLLLQYVRFFPQVIAVGQFDLGSSARRHPLNGREPRVSNVLETATTVVALQTKPASDTKREGGGGSRL